MAGSSVFRWLVKSFEPRLQQPCHAMHCTSGKSSILAALLGELQPTSARHVSGRGAGALSPVTVRGSVAYCSQVPWIVSGSLKVSLFGIGVDWYGKAIRHKLVQGQAI